MERFSHRNLLKAQTNLVVMFFQNNPSAYECIVDHCRNLLLSSLNLYTLLISW